MALERQGRRRIVALAAALLFAFAPSVSALATAFSARPAGGLPVCTARGIVWVPSGGKAVPAAPRGGMHLCCLAHGCTGALAPLPARSPEPAVLPLPRRISLGDEQPPGGGPIVPRRARAPPASREPLPQ